MALQNFGVVERRFPMGITAPRSLLLRAAQPDAEAWCSLRLLGVDQVVKLNTESDYSVAVEQAEAGPDVAIWEHAASQFSPTVDWCRTTVEIVAARLDQGQGHTVLVHCTLGRDRTTLFIGAWRILKCGWSVDACIAEAEHYGWTELVELVDSEIIECWRNLAERKRG